MFKKSSLLFLSFLATFSLLPKTNSQSNHKIRDVILTNNNDLDIRNRLDKYPFDNPDINSFSISESFFEDNVIDNNSSEESLINCDIDVDKLDQTLDFKFDFVYNDTSMYNGHTLLNILNYGDVYLQSEYGICLIDESLTNNCTLSLVCNDPFSVVFGDNRHLDGGGCGGSFAGAIWGVIGMVGLVGVLVSDNGNAGSVGGFGGSISHPIDPITIDTSSPNVLSESDIIDDMLKNGGWSDEGEINDALEKAIKVGKSYVTLSALEEMYKNTRPVVFLGKFNEGSDESYQKVAENSLGVAFSMNDDDWIKYSDIKYPNKMWLLNKLFLYKMIKLDCYFMLIHDPDSYYNKATNKTLDDSNYAKELKFIHKDNTMHRYDWDSMINVYPKKADYK